MSMSFKGHMTGDSKKPNPVIPCHGLGDPTVYKPGKARAENLGEGGFFAEPSPEGWWEREDPEKRLKYISLCTSKSP